MQKVQSVEDRNEDKRCLRAITEHVSFVYALCVTHYLVGNKKQRGGSFDLKIKHLQGIASIPRWIHEPICSALTVDADRFSRLGGAICPDV